MTGHPDRTTATVSVDRDRSRPEDVLVAQDLVAGYFPGVDILNGTTLHCARGELIGIIGPNGAGKSTLLKTLFGLVRVRSGGCLGGRRCNLKPNALVARGVGFVPQTNNVFPTLTVQENLEMGLFLAPHRFEERFGFAVSLFPALGHLRGRRAGALSGGERQMVAMSRALMSEPTVLLLDEPAAGLSPALQDEAFLRIREINRTGVSVVMVEQNARRCLQICDRGYVLDQGRNAYTGPGAELAADPRIIELYLGTA